MAYKVAEAYMNDLNTMIAVKAKDGGYLFFISTGVLADGKAIEDHGPVAKAIRDFNNEIWELKSK